MLAKSVADFEASRHVNLWTGKASEQYDFGGHHYQESAKEMYFWESK